MNFTVSYGGKQIVVHQNDDGSFEIPEEVRYLTGGTALKPAFEPIILARKPLDGTLAHNLETHGVGTLSIDACRIATDWSERSDAWKLSGHSSEPGAEKIAAPPGIGIDCNPLGRWPANVILDDVAGAMVDDQTGVLSRPGGVVQPHHAAMGYKGCAGSTAARALPKDSGGASRFFYCAKASTREREAGLEHLHAVAGHAMVGRADGAAGTNSPRAGAGRKAAARRNIHPTVKPLALTEYLARLILPPGGTGRILVPYAGVGSEMIGAVRAGWTGVVGIERDAAYTEIAEARLRHWTKATSIQEAG